MRARLAVNIKALEYGIQAALSKVGTGTKKATVVACEEILSNSLKEVPRDTDTLAESGAYEVFGGNRQYEGRVTYGVQKDAQSPKTGLYASQYAAVVHEDFEAWHEVGKVKFLEDPLLEFAKRFPRSYKKILKAETGI